MKNRLVQMLGWGLVGLVGGCIDPYRPAEITSPDTYLVVNGLFNSEPGTTTTIRLSRSQNLSDGKTPTAEAKAAVTIESDRSTVFPLRESSAGVYSLSGVTPVSGETYRLHIRTVTGKNYYSDYVPVLPTPPIDSISWQVEGEGVQVNVNTHDPRNNTRYYRWDFDEAWEYTSPHYSAYELINNQIVSRNEDVFRCWGSNSSKNISVNSTARLSQDVVSQFPLTFIGRTSVKLERKYSILVRQYALTQAGYAYYDQLARITQNIGSLFDPQPAQITGNIHSDNDPADLVLGFFQVGSVASKRIFIERRQLPPWPFRVDPNCGDIDTLSLAQIREQKPGILTEFPPASYLTAPFLCVDCRLRGGINKRPDFWE